MKFDKDLRSIYQQKLTDRGPVWVKCPFHSDSNPSFAVYSDHGYCYVCRTWEGYHDHLRRVGEEPPLSANETSDTHHEELSQQKIKDLVAIYHERLYKENAEAYFMERGISEQVISEQQLGYCGFAYSIPIWCNSTSHHSGEQGTVRQVSTIRFRRNPKLDTKGAKYWGLKGANSDLPMYLGLRPKAPVIWCEGELDTLLLYSLGFPSLTLTNGIGAVEREEIYGDIISSLMAAEISCILVGVDNDPASYRKGLQLVQRLRGDGFTASRVEFDEKDLGEVWHKDNSSIYKLMENHFATCRSYCKRTDCTLQPTNRGNVTARDS